MTVPFALLALAIGATWARPLPIGAWRVAPWLLLLAAAVAAGMIAGVLQWPALTVLALLLYCAHRASQEQTGRLQQWLFGTATGLLTLGLALHRFPGFHNPILIANVMLTPEAAPMTLYANFDKGAAGAILLACLCRQSRTRDAWRRAFRTTFAVGLLTIAAVVGLALIMDHVRPALKLPAFALVFLLVNLFFTCVAEEAFFRGFIQERLAHSMARRRMGNGIAVVVSALLFGVAHAGGGATMTVLATVAGLGYALAYARSSTVEAPIMVHFALKTVHFIGLTYPHVK